MGGLPSGELTVCNGKIHHAINGKIHYFYGHIQLLFVKLPEGMTLFYLLIPFLVG